MLLDFPNWFAGTFTLVALVGLGIFVYPWLLQRRGATVIGAITVVLTFVFYTFDRSSGVSIATSAILAALWALAPVAVGVIVWRLQGKPKSG
jgi:L-alanine-DL-glutamate epimerase-like enolase superfamily enzyme